MLESHLNDTATEKLNFKQMEEQIRVVLCMFKTVMIDKWKDFLFCGNRLFLVKQLRTLLSKI